MHETSPAYNHWLAPSHRAQFNPPRLTVSKHVPASVCAVASQGVEVFLAMDYLRNEGRAPAQITKVDLSETSNLVLQGFGILSHGNVATRSPGSGLQLDSNRAIKGKDAAAIQVKLRLENATHQGTANSLKMTYGDSESKDSAFLTMETTITVLPVGQTCK